jgi:hypothetical protein
MKRDVLGSNLMLVLLLVACLGGLFVFFLLVERDEAPARTEIRVAKGVDRGLYRYEDKMRYTEVYRLTLEQEAEAFTCDVAWPPMIRRWHELEIGQHYEFTIRFAGNKCYVEKAKPVDVGE